MYVQVPQGDSNLIFTYDGRDFISPVPALREVGRGITIEN